MSEKVTITNRRGLKLVIQVDGDENSEKLAFVAHGQKGFKEQVHIQAFADAFLVNGYRVVRFDATHALGESEGDVIDVTYDNYIEDLEDVINWAHGRSWFVQPFALCGHSMGGQSTAWYAEHHPDEVSLLATMAPVVNYDLHITTMSRDYVDSYRRLGYKEEPSRSKPGTPTRVGWGVMDSLKKYDLLPLANMLTMPVLDVVGEFDKPCPLKYQQMLFEKIPGEKKLVEIKGAEHSYRNNESGEYGAEVEEMKTVLDNWLRER